MDKLNLITRNLDEVLNLPDLQLRLEKKGYLNAYWGTAPTKSPHLAYFIPLLKIRDLIDAGCVVTIFLADVHSYLDEGFEAVSKVEFRTQYYEFILKEMLKSIGVDEHKYMIEKGSNVQLQPKYIVDLLKFSTLVSVHDAKRAGTETVKQNDNPRVSSLIYPLMQALDEEALDADVQLGGKDQRKIFAMSLDNIERMGLGYKKCSYLINPLVPSLNNKGKMSASDESGKITFLDSDNLIKKKINKSFCTEELSDITTNAPLALTKLLMFPIEKTITILRPEKYGGNVTYHNFMDLEQDWIDGKLSSVDLKCNLAKFIIKLIGPIRDALKENLHLYTNAYA